MLARSGCVVRVGSLTRRGLEATACLAASIPGPTTLARRATRRCLAIGSAERACTNFRPAGYAACVAAPLALALPHSPT